MRPSLDIVQSGEAHRDLTQTGEAPGTARAAGACREFLGAAPACQHLIFTAHVAGPSIDTISDPRKIGRAKDQVRLKKHQEDLARTGSTVHVVGKLPR